MTLNELKVGQSGVITAVGGDGPLRCRLLDMGLIPRTAVRLQRYAPWGPHRDPRPWVRADPAGGGCHEYPGKGETV